MPQATREILAVDLDGTLLRTDMLFESFWLACARDWKAPFRVLAGVLGGRAGVKHLLAVNCDVPAATLPYNDAVIAYVVAWRERGGRTALVTASSLQIATRIADHLGIFDEVHGSSETVNLKGLAKADHLEATYGVRAFAYIGDSVADLHVWERSKGIVAVDPSRSLRSGIARISSAPEFIVTRKGGLKPYLRQLRPHQWSKNLLMFVPLVATHSGGLHEALMTLMAFVAFSLIASSVYVLNDLLDLSADRAHLRKRKRPLASGDLPIAHGSLMLPLLLGSGILLSLAVGWMFLGVVAAYCVVTLAYSFYLKRKILIDICALAGLYTLRIIAGAAVTGIHLSVWLLAFSTFLFFSLAAVKRQSELNHHALSGHNALVGRGYRVTDLPIISQMGISSGYIAVLVLALYIDAPTTTQFYSFPEALWGICMVLLFWISRMVFITNRGRMHDDPVFFAIKDRVSRYCVALVLLFTIASVTL